MGVSAETPARPHIDVLDGLRALAIILVMWLHTWQLSWIKNYAQVGGYTLNWGLFPETGFLGVELFFFISGFCLYYPYARHVLEGAPLPTLKSYCYRRAIKILPSYWLAIAILVAVAPFATPTDWCWQLGTHLAFIHNWWTDTENTINGVFWSLAVEVQFYLLFPAICWAFRRKPPVVWALMNAVALAWRFWIDTDFPASDAPWLLNQLPGYLDFFAGGMLAAHALTAWRPRLNRPWLCTGLAMAGFAAFGWLTYDLWLPRYVMPFWPCGWQVEHRTYLALAFFVMTVASAGALKAWRVLLANPVLAFLSTISYNLYIWHQVIARQLFQHRIPVPATPDAHDDPTWQWQYMLLTWAVSIAVAALITYVFERPLLKHGLAAWWPRRKAPAEELKSAA